MGLLRWESRSFPRNFGRLTNYEFRISGSGNFGGFSAPWLCLSGQIRGLRLILKSTRLPTGQALHWTPDPSSPENQHSRCECCQASSPFQWGRRLSASGINLRWACVPCHRPLQWGRRLSASGISLLLGAINGWYLQASMGPPPFGERNFIVSPSRKKKVKLQWGRRLSASGIVLGPVSHQVLGNASMGPPPFGERNAGGAATGDRTLRLQWGRRLSASGITPTTHKPPI